MNTRKFSIDTHILLLAVLLGMSIGGFVIVALDNHIIKDQRQQIRRRDSLIHQIQIHHIPCEQL